MNITATRGIPNSIKLNQQAIDEKMNGKRSIITHLFSFLSPSLREHMLGVRWWRRERKRRGYKLQPLHAPRNMQQKNQRNEQRKE
jgi:hypothetical protein